MENYSFNLNELVISDNLILRKSYALRLYNAIAFLYMLFVIYWLYKIVQHVSVHLYVYLFCLIVNLLLLIWLFRRRRKIKHSVFSVCGIATVIVKRLRIARGLGSLLPIGIWVILKKENGNSQRFRVLLDENSFNALIFELIDRNIKIEER